MNINICNMLKQLRKTSGLSAEKVIKELSKYQIEIKQKTLYGYESGLSMPNADTFIALCKIYKCDNPISFFENNTHSPEEVKLIEDFRILDAQGQSTVRYILDNELKRCQTERELSNKITELENAPKPVPTRVWAYYGKIAAAGTFVEFADMIAGTKEYAVTDENRNADYTIGISGDSMEPIYYDGDIVFVKHSTNLTIGDIGIFQHDNGIYIKEYGDGELLSKNPKYKPMCYDEGFQCLGKVIAKADA